MPQIAELTLLQLDKHATISKVYKMRFALQQQKDTFGEAPGVRRSLHYAEWVMELAAI